MAELRVGTSGWMYKDWGATFYPPELKKGHLSFLAHEFDTVEVNSSFYHLPLNSTFAKWKQETPDAFLFSVKLSRYITHERRLTSIRQPLARFLARARSMNPKLAVILIQLPPFLKYDKKTLERFVEDLRVVSARVQTHARYALEPRHATWMENGDDVKAVLSRRNIALVFPHSRKIPSFAPEDANITADFVYVRFHGPSEFAASRYGPARLKPWAERIVRWTHEGLDVFVYFNNDIHGHAIHDARTLKRQIARLARRV